MAQTVLKTGAAPQKYGVVTVFNADGTLNREFKITGAEYAALAQAGAGAPPTVTKAEWEATRSVLLKDGRTALQPLAMAVGKDYDVGDIRQLPDGSVQMKVDERVVNGQFVESFTRIKAGDFTGTVPNITCAPTVISALDQSRSVIQIQSIVAGVVTWL